MSRNRKQLEELFRDNRTQFLDELHQCIHGNYATSSEELDQLKSLFQKKKPHIWVFLKFCEAWGLPAIDARQFYNSKSLADRQYLDHYITKLIAAEDV